MHPAPSVILFSSLSGLGFGLLFWLGLGFPNVEGLVAFVFFAIAYALAVGGLIASTFHLGHPERALGAFTQWKTSWLSREAWMSVGALVFMGLYAAALVFLNNHIPVLGFIGAAFSLATVYTTSMIYGQLKTVPRWNMSLTSPMFLTISVAGGALIAGQITAALILLVIAGLVQVAYWVSGDKAFANSGTDMASATGLGNIGSVTAFEPPHTGTNYLLKEMVHVIGRKHALKLRVIALILMVVLPVVLLLLSQNHFVALVAAVSHLIGVMASRWLFFAEAEHVVGLYYGKR
ncbi:MAG: DmsC/YnfH family molybdoenzyme membrane anchor subunit [Rhodobacterales bacterium]|nr:DmsC/YnfH family molybdoenzyme membrane anchor subunit [Rhodobacterales bacterium]